MHYKSGLSDPLAKKLISHFDNPAAVVSATKAQLKTLDWFPQRLLHSWNWNKSMEVAAEELEQLEKHGISCLPFYHPDYPYRLKQCIDGPLLLFFKGQLPWTKKRWISIVGTRRMTRYGHEQTEEIVRQLLPFDPVIVSGLAFGVDITAHLAALEFGLSTVACMAHGLDHIHPRTHKFYAQQLLKNGGLLSETWTRSGFHNKYFIRRNRIIAGLSDATVVVESAVKGGSLTTADMAFSYDRAVYAVPGRMTDVQSVGCNNLIEKQVAQVYSCVATLADDLGWNRQKNSGQGKLDLQFKDKLSTPEQELLQALPQSDCVHIEAILKKKTALRAQIPALLLSLELKGWLKALPGQQYRRL